MRRFGCTALVLTVLIATGACKNKKKGDAELATPPEPEAKVESILIPSKVDAVDFRILFMTGSVDDPEGKEGLTALTARMMVEGGTESHTYPELLAKLYPMAAKIDVQVDKEMTVFTARVHRDHLEQFIPLLTEVVTRPRFDEKAFGRLRTDAVNSIEKGLRMTNDEQLAIQSLDVWIFDGHPYGHLVEGTVQGLGSISLDDVRKHYENVFTRDRLVVGMAGAVDEKLGDRVSTALAVLPEKGVAAVEIPSPPPIEGIHVRIIEKETASTVITMGHPLDVGRDHEDFYALWLAQSALGEHRQSTGRLFTTIREKRGLNYGDYAYIEPYVNHGRTTKPTLNIARSQHTFNVWIRSVPSQNRLFALKLTFWTLKQFVEKGMTQDELDRVQGFLDGYTRVFEESLDRRLGYALDDLFYGASKPFLTEARERFKTVSLAQVNQAIEDDLDLSNLKIVIVTKDAETLRDQLAGNVTAEVSYHTPKSEGVLVEDQSVVDFDAGISAANIEVVPVEELFEQ